MYGDTGCDRKYTNIPDTDKTNVLALMFDKLVKCLFLIYGCIFIYIMVDSGNVGDIIFFGLKLIHLFYLFSVL